MNILILYGSSEGQTAQIAQRITELIREKGHQVTVQSGDDLPGGFAVDDFDAAIIGGSIHMGKYQPYVKAFIRAHCKWLSSVPTALFTVCMAVSSRHAKDRAAARAYGERLLKETGWRPVLIETFAGAVKYTRYGFITRFVMKQISKREGGSTDTSCDHEYTDWAEVERFVEAFLARIGERAAQPA